MAGLKCFILQARTLLLSDGSVQLGSGGKLCLGPCSLFSMEESSGPDEPCLGEKEANSWTNWWQWR